jgi:hypothetical protein
VGRKSSPKPRSDNQAYWTLGGAKVSECAKRLYIAVEHFKFGRFRRRDA